MKTLIVYRKLPDCPRQYLRRMSYRIPLWCDNPNDALPMTMAQATALAERLQRSADMAGPATQPPGEYGVQPLGVQETTP